MNTTIVDTLSDRDGTALMDILRVKTSVYNSLFNTREKAFADLKISDGDSSLPARMVVAYIDFMLANSADGWVRMRDAIEGMKRHIPSQKAARWSGYTNLHITR